MLQSPSQNRNGRNIFSHSMISILLILIPKSDRDIQRKEKYTPIFHIKLDLKIHNKNQEIESNIVQKELFKLTKWDLLFQVCKAGSIFENHFI